MSHVTDIEMTFEKNSKLLENSNLEDEAESPTDTMEDLQSGVIDSIEPLTKNKILKEEQLKEEEAEESSFKEYLSMALSVFNLMNAILGSGILGLADALKNVGIFPFIFLLLLTASLASYTINLLLHMSQLVSVKTYEELAEKSFGKRGKLFTTIIITLHCLGAMCSYVFIVKKELPEFFYAILGHSDKWYLSGNFLMITVVLFVIVPLSAMKDIKFLGYSSAFGMMCMLLFTFTVVAKRSTIPCPLPLEEDANLHIKDIIASNTTTKMFTTTLKAHDEEEQICEPQLANFNSRTAYAVPTMFFSFMCHASMLPIYSELRKPSIRKMQRVANISIFNVLFLYFLSAMFGYFTFFNKVESELLLTYSKFERSNPATLVSRFMVIICVTLSVPLLHYPARKTIVVTFFRNPNRFSWFRHLMIMFGFITLTVCLVLFIPDIRDIFGLAGATTSCALLVILPSAFVIRLTGSGASPSVSKRYQRRRRSSWFLFVFGIIFMILSTVMIVIDWANKKQNKS